MWWDCSAIELAELQCAPLAVATIREQHRLAALHTLLFSVGESARVHLTSRICTFLLTCGPRVPTEALPKETCGRLQATAHANACAILVSAHVHVARAEDEAEQGVAWVAGGRPQPLSLQSFVWAHCLVRSRALSLHLPAAGGSEGGAGSRGASPPGQLDMCMLPGVDLCNHPTEGPASCAVHLRLSRTRTRYIVPSPRPN